METPNCPVCFNPMMPNIEGKMKNPKAPDFKCASDNCKFQWDKSLNKWVESKFKTAVWSNDLESPKPSPAASGGLTGASRAAQQVQNNLSRNIQSFEAKKEEAMKTMSSGRDAVLITVAEMAQGGAWDDALIQEHIKNWAKWMRDNIYDPPFVS